MFLIILLIGIIVIILLFVNSNKQKQEITLTPLNYIISKPISSNKCDRTDKSYCILKDYETIGDGLCVAPTNNQNNYSGINNYNNNKFIEWLDILYDRDAGSDPNKTEKVNVVDYVNRCKNELDYLNDTVAAIQKDIIPTSTTPTSTTLTSTTLTSTTPRQTTLISTTPRQTTPRQTTPQTITPTPKNIITDFISNQEELEKKIKEEQGKNEEFLFNTPLIPVFKQDNWTAISQYEGEYQIRVFYNKDTMQHVSAKWINYETDWWYANFWPDYDRGGDLGSMFDNNENTGVRFMGKTISSSHTTDDTTTNTSYTNSLSKIFIVITMPVLKKFNQRCCSFSICWALNYLPRLMFKSFAHVNCLINTE